MNQWHASLFTGLFTRFGPMLPRPHDPAFALSSGVAASWLPHRETTTSSGIGWDEAAAEGACVGEAIERLQCGPLSDDLLVGARFDAWPLPEPAIAPATWVLFHPDQYRQPGFPFQPLTGESLCDWVCCRRVITGEPWWIPAELAYLHQPAGQIRLVMSVHKRKHTYGRACLQFRFGQSASHQVADCLRAGPAGLPEKGLKPGQQFRFHRDTEPHRAGIFIVLHGVTHCRIVTPDWGAVKQGGAVCLAACAALCSGC